jgi:TPR repeat protein
MPFCCWCDAKNAASTCGACLLTHYCGPDCQKAHWKSHKIACKELQRDMREDLAAPWFKHVVAAVKRSFSAVSETCASCDREDVETFVCEPCGVVTYCSVECQRKDWRREHKVACPLIARATFHVAMESALKGDAGSCVFVGLCYITGRHVGKDEGEAFRWMKRAAEAGDATAQCNLGISYANGIGVAADRVEAIRWCKRAAEAGVTQAQYNLGTCYADGIGTTADPVEAFRWFKRAAEAGYAQAQYNLGVCYAKGDGVAADSLEAVRWYKRAGEAGHADAQYNLGVHYSQGTDVAADLPTALLWAQRAAAGGLEEAKDFVAELEALISAASTPGLVIDMD